MRLVDIFEANDDDADIITCEHCGEDVEREEAVHGMHHYCYMLAKKDYMDESVDVNTEIKRLLQTKVAVTNRQDGKLYILTDLPANINDDQLAQAVPLTHRLTKPDRVNDVAAVYQHMLQAAQNKYRAPGEAEKRIGEYIIPTTAAKFTVMVKQQFES